MSSVMLMSLIATGLYQFHQRAYFHEVMIRVIVGAAIGSAALSLGLKIFWPTLPFIDRVGLAFVCCVALGMLISSLQGSGEQPDAINYKEVDTSTTTGFNLASLVIVLLLTGLYITWW